MKSLAMLLILGLIVAVAGEHCQVPFKSVGGKCLHVEYGSQGGGMTWQDARDYCISLGGTDFDSDLASYPTCASYTEFERYLAFNAPSNTSLWMGAHTLFTPSMWQWVTLEDLQTGVPFWAYNEDFHDAEKCAATSPDNYHRLMAFACEDTKGFACTYTPDVAAEQEPVIAENDHDYHDCPSDGIQVGEYCYVFHDYTTSFSRAEDSCRSSHDSYSGWKGELYYPCCCEEFTHLAHHLEASEDRRSYWVGAIDISGAEEWTWVDGNSVPGGPPYWAAGEPSHTPDAGAREYCAVMAYNERFYLRNDKCSESHRYICKLTKQQ